MYSLHRNWGDGLIARRHCSCFVFFGFFIFLFLFICFVFWSLHLALFFFSFLVASTSSIQAPCSHGIMKHEPICVTYGHQLKSGDNINWERWGILCMDQDMDMLLLSNPPSSSTLPKSDDIYLGKDDDHQGETRHKFRSSWSIIRLNRLITTFMTST